MEILAKKYQAARDYTGNGGTADVTGRAEGRPSANAARAAQIFPDRRPGDRRQC